MNYRVIQFNNPCHETDGRFWINLDIEKIKSARKNKEMIVLKLPTGYTKPIDPKRLLKEGVRTEAVFLRPEEPMKLCGTYYSLMSQEEQEKFENRDLIAAMS